MDCMREETFGPTLPIMRYSEESEAIALANDSEYGLSASVWSKDRRRAERVALQLDCGTVNINDVIMNLSCLTMHGGWKGSGWGRVSVVWTDCASTAVPRPSSTLE